jgi:hypothetical protein
MSQSTTINHAEQFNNCIKEIFAAFKGLKSKTFGGKLHIDELHKKMLFGMRTEERYAISIFGPFILRARENIAARNAAYFLARRYELEVQKLCTEHKVDFNDAINTVGYMKEAFRDATDDQKNAILDLIIKLLQVTINAKLAKVF